MTAEEVYCRKLPLLIDESAYFIWDGPSYWKHFECKLRTLWPQMTSLQVCITYSDAAWSTVNELLFKKLASRQSLKRLIENYIILIWQINLNPQAFSVDATLRSVYTLICNDGTDHCSVKLIAVIWAVPNFLCKMEFYQLISSQRRSQNQTHGCVGWSGATLSE